MRVFRSGLMFRAWCLELGGPEHGGDRPNFSFVHKEHLLWGAGQSTQRYFAQKHCSNGLIRLLALTVFPGQWVAHS